MSLVILQVKNLARRRAGDVSEKRKKTTPVSNYRKKRSKMISHSYADVTQVEIYPISKPDDYNHNHNVAEARSLLHRLSWIHHEVACLTFEYK